MAIPSLASQIQGQGTVSADNLNTYIQTAQMSSELRVFTGLPGMVVQLQGIALPNDGLGGFFFWNASGTEPDDNYNYIVPTGSTTGEWERILFPTNPGPGIFTTITVSALATFKSDVIIEGILSESIETGLIGAGSAQSTATLLTANINIATTVASGTGFLLPILTPSGNTIRAGTSIKLLNCGANIASLYPPSGAEINLLEQITL